MGAALENMLGWFIAAAVIMIIAWVCARNSLLVFMFLGGTAGSNPSDPILMDRAGSKKSSPSRT
jgi:hypothetical protein